MIRFDTTLNPLPALTTDTNDWPSPRVPSRPHTRYPDHVLAGKPYIAVFWTASLDVSSGGAIYAGPLSSSEYAVVYENVAWHDPQYGTGGHVTAELKLHKCGLISIAMISVVMPDPYSDEFGSLVVGIESYYSSLKTCG
jgi:hypothetical protein